MAEAARNDEPLGASDPEAEIMLEVQEREDTLSGFDWKRALLMAGEGEPVPLSPSDMDEHRADWYLSRVGVLEAEMAKLVEHHAREVKLLDRWLAHRTAALDREHAFRLRALEEYMRERNRAVPSLKTLPLPHGQLRLRAQRGEIELGENVAAWVVDNTSDTKYWKPSPLDTSALRKDLEPVKDGEDVIFTPTGEILPAEVARFVPPGDPNFHYDAGVNHD